MKALVIGATGAVGRDLVNLLLADSRISGVTIFVRKDPGITHTKLETRIIDFDNPSSWIEDVRGDVLFSCLGTTLKLAGSKKAQWKIDYDYQLEFAKAAEQNSVSQYVLVSSIGASSKSPNFYTKMKGTLEDKVRGLGFRHTVIVRPPSLIRKGTDRFSEKLSVPMLKYLNALGLMRNFAPVRTEDVAACMVKSALSGHNGTEIISYQDIH